MILRLFTIALLLLALHGQVQAQTDNSTTPTATTTPTPTATATPTPTPTPTVTVSPTTETPTTTAPTTTAPTTTSPPTTTTPPTTPSTTTATPTTATPTTQTPTTLPPTTPAATTRPPTTPPPTIEDRLLLTTSNQGKILNAGITALRLSGNTNYPNNGTITLRVMVDGTSTGSKVLTISPRIDDVLNIPAPATLIPLSIGSRVLKGLALDVDDNSAITNVRIYSPQLSTTIYNRISDANTAVGLFVLQKDDQNNRKYSWVAPATIESLQQAVSAEIPGSAVGLDSILVFASYPTPPTVTASLATNISIIETIGALNATVNYANTGLSVRVGSPVGNQLHVEKVYGLNEKQEIARRNFGNALVYFKISLNNENVPQDTLLSYTFTQQELNNAGIPSGSQLRWGYYFEQRNVWVQSGTLVDSAGGVVTTNTNHLSTWGVFDTRGPNAASATSISIVTVIATLIACMVHLF